LLLTNATKFIKKIMENKKKVRKMTPVREVSINATLRAIPVGETVRFFRKDFGSETSVRSAASRMNSKAGKILYSVKTIDRGDYYDITRNE